MAIKEIDTLQTAQITALQADVAELRLKLNLVVTDIQTISAKVNILIDDLNDLNDVVMAGYTTPSSPQAHGILEEMENYTDAMEAHAEIQSQKGGWTNIPPWTYTGGYIGDTFEHPHAVTTSTLVFGGSSSSRKNSNAITGSGGSSSTPGGTGQGGNVAHSADAADASVIHAYGAGDRILAIKDSSIIRAQKLARQTLNRLRNK